MSSHTSDLESIEAENIAATLARVLPRPAPIASPDASYQTGGVTITGERHLALPPGWTLQLLDDEKFLPYPRRVRATAAVDDLASFIAYIERNTAAQPATTVWCKTDPVDGALRFLAILNDNEDEQDLAGWRDHRCAFEPRKSVEWLRWKAADRKQFSQLEFAAFLEDNRVDIATVDGLPTGAQMLELALNMEATQDVRFKSAIRLASGGVQLQFVQDDDAQTLARMQLFERFAIGIPVFWGGAPYRLDARLRYRVRDGRAVFWFELERADRVFDAAAATLIEQVREQSGVPFFFGQS
jgi:uncharacterized protein YfdQ (DUF2303 family)